MLEIRTLWNFLALDKEPETSRVSPETEDSGN